jgi:hypothetical protein
MDSGKKGVWGSDTSGLGCQVGEPGAVLATSSKKDDVQCGAAARAHPVNYQHALAQNGLIKRTAG